MTKPFIELDNCDVLLQGQPVLQNVSWQLHSGENWAFVGGNGAGKSTLLKLVRGDIWPLHSKGSRIYRFDGVETFSPLRARDHIGRVSGAQHDRYRRQEWKLVGREVVLSGFFNSELLHQKPTQAQIEQAQRLTHELGIEPLLERDINTLSHGELRKLLIARALVTRPKVLVLDEFCSGLDAVSRAQTLQFVEELAARNVQLLMATHRRDEVVASITHVAKLANGRIVAQGRQEDILPHSKQRAPRIEYSIATASKQNRYQTLVEIENADVFRDGAKILRDLNWTWKNGEHWRVRGANGSGKSTFLKLIAGDLWPAFGGTIRRFDNAQWADIWQMKARIGLVSPELQERYADDFRGWQVVASGFFSTIGVLPILSAEQREAVEQTLQLGGIEDLGDKLITQMSSGEARKVLLARALVNDPDLLLLDEPFDSLDADSVLDFKTLLGQAARRGTHLMLASHHDEDFPPLFRHELVFENGAHSSSKSSTK
ncbi:MAG TPA: ATP-binding cassette domain-containing protein [Abditibacteriaceae bacterium]|nr:ATP-binding cassette domain-containing protein [Abditibacteriaceae bacterium]